MAKLGYTWYPQNWNNSDRVFDLNLAQRGLYRELIDRAMTCDNKIVFDPKKMARRLNSCEQELLEIISFLKELGLVEQTENRLFLPECEPRLNLIRGGKKGGQKSRKNKPISKPTDKPKNKPIPKLESKPTLNQRERESKEKDMTNVISKKSDADLKNSEKQQGIDGAADEVSDTANEQQEINKKAVRFAKQLEDPKEQLWRETFYMQQGLRKGSLGRLLQDFNKHLVLKPPNKPKYDYREYKTHFIHWVNKQAQLKKLQNHKL